MPVLDVAGVSHSFGKAQVLDDVSFTVERGEIVTIIGPNGAGKTTLLNVLSRATTLQKGRVLIRDRDSTSMSQSKVVRNRCVLVPEGRQVFSSMTVIDNLLLGAFSRRRDVDVARAIDPVMALFPELLRLRGQLAGTLSGGEQQMVAIGRAMMAAPEIMLLDEPSLGLSPQLVQRIMSALQRLCEEGLSIVLVEQNANAALQLADRAYLLSMGRIVTSGSSAAMRDDPMVRAVYLGAEPIANPREPII